MLSTIQPFNTMTPIRFRAVDAYSDAPVGTPNLAPRDLTPSAARWAAASTQVESSMPDFEILNGRLAPNTNDLSAFACGNFVEGTV